MKLVSIHKHIILIFLTIGFQAAQAQVWSLDQCLDTARIHNKNLQIGSNNISLSDQKEKEAKANLIPKVTANADYRYYFNLPYQLMPLSAFGGPSGEYNAIQFGVPNVINANVQVSVPLYNAHVYGAIQATKVASELTDLQYQKTEEQVYFEVSNLYYNAQILHHQLGFIESNITNARSLLNNMQLLNEQLLARATDVSKVKLQVSQLTDQKEIVRNKYDQVLNALKFVMGISVAQNLAIEPEIQYKNPIDYALSSTLDLRIIKTKNLLLKSELNTLNRSRYLPSLNLVGTYGTTGFGYNGLPSSFLDFYPIGFVGAQLSYPLFSGTVTQRKINQKRIELQNNELQFELNTEQNRMEVENAELQRLVTKKSVATTTEQIELAKTIYEQTILQQTQGTASLSDVLMVDNALREAQQTYLSAVIEYLKADLELKKLTGNITTSK